MIKYFLTIQLLLAFSVVDCMQFNINRKRPANCTTERPGKKQFTQEAYEAQMAALKEHYTSCDTYSLIEETEPARPKGGLGIRKKTPFNSHQGQNEQIQIFPSTELISDVSSDGLNLLPPLTKSERKRCYNRERYEANKHKKRDSSVFFAAPEAISLTGITYRSSSSSKPKSYTLTPNRVQSLIKSTNLMRKHIN